MDGRSLADVAEGYAGTPFWPGGREPGRALDCAGVVICALAELGIPTAPHAYVLGHGHDHKVLMEDLARAALVEAAEPLERGDVVFLRAPHMPNHMAVFLGNTMIVHSVPRRGVLLTPMDLSLRSRIVAVWRIA